MQMYLFVLSVLAISVAGCDQAPMPGIPNVAHSPVPKDVRVPIPFGDSAARTHDFGSIPGYAGLRLTHRYPMTNGSDRAVKLLRAVNGKPCCGDIGFEPVTLEPGGTAWLEVILRVGGGDEPLSHFASVATDHPEAQVLEFRTSAQPRPRFVIERADESTPSVKLGETKEISLVARSFGVKDRPPVDLDRLKFESDITVEWDGLSSETKTPEGSVERTRKARAILKAAGTPGQRITTVGIRHDDETIPVPPLTWQVEPVLAFEPKALILLVSESAVEKTITLSAGDGKPIEITDITSDMPSLKLQAERSEMSPAQSIRVSFDPKVIVKARTGTITVTTTHLSQPVATVGVFLTRPSTADTGTDSEPNRQPTQGESR